MGADFPRLGNPYENRQTVQMIYHNIKSNKIREGFWTKIENGRIFTIRPLLFDSAGIITTKYPLAGDFAFSDTERFDILIRILFSDHPSYLGSRYFHDKSDSFIP